MPTIDQILNSCNTIPKQALAKYVLGMVEIQNGGVITPQKLADAGLDPLVLSALESEVYTKATTGNKEDFYRKYLDYYAQGTPNYNAGHFNDVQNKLNTLVQGRQLQAWQDIQNFQAQVLNNIPQGANCQTIGHWTVLAAGRQGK